MVVSGLPKPNEERHIVEICNTAYRVTQCLRKRQVDKMQ